MLQLNELMAKCSDWGTFQKTVIVNLLVETDDNTNERLSPWPAYIHEEVLVDRVKARNCMKEKLDYYQNFLNLDGLEFANWWKNQPTNDKKRIFQYPMEDVMNYFRLTCDVRGAYSIVLCAISEQVMNFNKTGYTDGRTAAELTFEKNLEFKNGAFIVNPSYYESDDAFIAMMYQLAGPRLLPSDRNKEEDTFETNPKPRLAAVTSVSVCV